MTRVNNISNILLVPLLPLSLPLPSLKQQQQQQQRYKTMPNVNNSRRKKIQQNSKPDKNNDGLIRRIYVSGHVYDCKRTQTK